MWSYAALLVGLVVVVVSFAIGRRLESEEKVRERAMGGFVQGDDEWQRREQGRRQRREAVSGDGDVLEAEGLNPLVVFL